MVNRTRVKTKDSGLTQEHDDIGLHHQLALRGAMDVGHATILRLVDQRWSTDMIPHLTRDHGEAEEYCDGTPQILVVQELQVISPNVKKTSHQGHQCDHGHGARIVWWTENANGDVRSLGNEFRNRIGGEADAMDIHGVSSLWLALGREMHEHRGGVQAQKLENLGAVIEIHHSKEEFVGVSRGEAVGVGHDGELVVGVPTDLALSRWSQCGEHYDHRVIPWCTLHILPKLGSIEAEQRLFGVHVHQVLYFFRQRESRLKGIRYPLITCCIFL